MQAWKRVFYICLALLIAHGFLMPNTLDAQGEVVRPKPRNPEKPETAQPDDDEEPAPEAVGIRSIGDVTIGFVPFFSADRCFDDRSEETFNKWTRKAIKSLLKEDAYRLVRREWIPMDEVGEELFDDLPTSRIRNAADLLSPLANRGIEGVMATWVEDKGDSYDLVVAFYLPYRIQLETHRLSANFERSTLPEGPDGGFVEEPTQDLMKELVRRNLNRILPIDAPAHTPATPSPSSGGPKEKAEGEEHKEGKGKDESGGPPTFAVLDFSREFSMDRAAIRKFFSDSPTTFSFGGAATDLLKTSFSSNQVLTPKSSKAVTFDQVEAPVLDLDPDADPNAREKALLARAGGSVDNLIFGHLREERKKKDQPSLWLYVRLLKKNGSQYSYHSADPREWQGNREDFHWDEGTIQSVLRSALFETLSRAGMPIPDDSEDRELILRAGHTVFKIAKKCYGGQDVAYVQRVLGQRNRLESNDEIKRGHSFFLPLKIRDNKLQNKKFCR